MDKELKNKIKLEVKQIAEEVEFEEDEFNRMFRSNIEFQKSYIRFLTIYEKYGKEAYLKYVPSKFRNQELRQYIKDEDFVNIYERFGLSTIKNLQYTYNLTSSEYKTTSTFKLLLIKIKKIFSKRFISLSQQTILLLPENINNIENFEIFEE